MRLTLTADLGPEEKATFDLDTGSRRTFGRGSAVDVRLDLEGLAEEHFRVEVAPEVCRLVDFGRGPAAVLERRAGGGVVRQDMLDGKAAIATELRDGDVVRVGNLRLDVRVSERRALCEVCRRDVTETAFTRNARRPIARYVCEACRSDHVAYGRRIRLPDLGFYWVEKEIGRGVFGRVFKARDRFTGRPFAIKMLHADRASDRPERHAQFTREMQIVSQLRHPSVVGFEGWGWQGETRYLVMEHVDGLDLEAFLERRPAGRLAIHEFLPMMLDLLDGLAYAHRETIEVALADGRIHRSTGVVHRDLKPANVIAFETAAGRRAKIADLGMAKAFRAAGYTALTPERGFRGNLAYMPLEQLTHFRYLGPPSDVFSMAAVFYRALTGLSIRPALGSMVRQELESDRPLSPGQLAKLFRRNPVPPIRDTYADLPQPVATVIDRALREQEVGPDKPSVQGALAALRYPDAVAFRDELGRALREAGVTRMLR